MQCFRPLRVRDKLLPCGKCPACLANIRQEWCFRLNSEFLACSFGLFVTLTYDDEHLPQDLSVNKRDVQLFLKRLRKDLGNRSFRYFITAEYGDHTLRPHYHGLFFFSFPFVSKIYDQIVNNWKCGFCDFGDIEPASVAYCTKYCMKLTVCPEGRTPPFRLMSKCPAIGSNYLEKNSVYHVETMNMSRVALPWSTSRMPRLFRDKLKENFTERYRLDKIHEAHVRYEIETLKGLERWKGDFDSYFDEQIGKQQRREEIIVNHIKKQKL